MYGVANLGLILLNSSASDNQEFKKIAGLVFERFDEDKNGILEEQEYQDAVEELTEYMVTKFAREDFNYSTEDLKSSLRFDIGTHPDGRIEKEDFMDNLEKILVRLNRLSPGEHHLKELLARIDARIAEQLFHQFDQDKNGLLEKQEYEKVVEKFSTLMVAKWDKLGISYSTEDCRTALRWDIDQDHDGVITMKEFLDAAQKMMEPSDCLSFSRMMKFEELLDRINDADNDEWREAAEQVFELFDTDKNGKLEEEEHHEALEALTGYLVAKFDQQGISYCKEDLKISRQYDLDEDIDGTITKEEFMDNIRKFLSH